MYYLKLTNSIPEKYSIGKLRRDNPNVSFPRYPTDSLLATFDVYPYTRPDRPDVDHLTAKIVDGSFEQDAVGNWSLPYVVEQLDQATAEQNVRDRRDALLRDCDWVTIRAKELGQPVPIDWYNYRGDLRQIPEQDGFPYSVVWPTKPE